MGYFWSNITTDLSPFLSSLTAQTISTLAVGTVGTLVALWGIYTQRAIARRRATLDLLVKQETDKDIIEATNFFISVCKAGKLLDYIPKNCETVETDLPQKPQAAKATNQTKLEDHEIQENKISKSKGIDHIRLVLNQFEIIAVGIEFGIIDYDIFKTWHEHGTISKWNASHKYIHEVRQVTGNYRLYAEFETLVSWLKGKGPPKKGRIFRKWF